MLAVSLPRLVLASTSPYRREILARLDVPFTVRAPDVDERAHDVAFASQTPEAFAQMLALAKADAVVDSLASEPQNDLWVLGADQLAILPGDSPVLLHKPGTAVAAIDQLMSLAGREHHLVTGVALVSARTRERFTGADRVTLRMRAFDRAEATAYVAAYQPLDCVGAYRIEDAGIRLFSSIAGSADPTSIIGLPLVVVCRVLRQAGLLPA